MQILLSGFRLGDAAFHAGKDGQHHREDKQRGGTEGICRIAKTSACENVAAKGAEVLSQIAQKHHQRHSGVQQPPMLLHAFQNSPRMVRKPDPQCEPDRIRRQSQENREYEIVPQKLGFRIGAPAAVPECIECQQYGEESKDRIENRQEVLKTVTEIFESDALSEEDKLAFLTEIQAIYLKAARKSDPKASDESSQ